MAGYGPAMTSAPWNLYIPTGAPRLHRVPGTVGWFLEVR